MPGPASSSSSRVTTALIEALAQALGRSLEADAIARMARFAELVATWNAKLDLTAARTPAALVEVLFADAIVLSDHSLVRPGESVLDVGSGAGAPAIPLAILRSDVRLTMIEPIDKRVSFLRTAIGSLDLAERARALKGRIDPKAPVAPVESDVAMARATFAPALWLEVGLQLCDAAVVLGVDALPSGARLIERRDYSLPSGAPRVAGRFEV